MEDEILDFAICRKTDAIKKMETYLGKLSFESNLELLLQLDTLRSASVEGTVLIFVYREGKQGKIKVRATYKVAA